MTALDFAATFGLGVGILLAVAIFVFAIQRQKISAVNLAGAIAALIVYGACESFPIRASVGSVT